MTVDGIAFSSPLYHMPSSDGTHMTAFGYKWLGHYEGRAAKQMLLDGKKPAFLKPGRAWSRGRYVYWKWAVPQRPLRLDTQWLPPTKDFGFGVVSDGAPVTIEAVEIIDGDTVRLRVGADLGTTTQVRYALDNIGSGTSWSASRVRTGNLRDSTPDTAIIEGVEVPLFHVAPSYFQTVTKLGTE